MTNSIQNDNPSSLHSRASTSSATTGFASRKSTARAFFEAEANNENKAQFRIRYEPTRPMFKEYVGLLAFEPGIWARPENTVEHLLHAHSPSSQDSCWRTLGSWETVIASRGELLLRSSSRLPSMTHVKSAAVPLSPANVANLFDSVDAFLFDCDGVIWKGDKLIDGVPETLEMLRSKGKQLIFVTNNSTKSRRQYAKKFHALGIPVSEDEIFSSSFAAAMYLKVNSFPPEKKVYVIGMEGILEELQLAGYTGLGGPEDAGKTVDWKQNWLLEHDEKVGAVVVGLDPNINYYKLQYATLCIRENPGCIFVATNRDAVGHMTDLQEWPGAGCMVAAVCGSTEREPVVVGKPSIFMMEFLREKFDISCSKMCMVGDRLDTDILFGHNAGCKTLLVFTGVTTQRNLEDPSNTIQPDYYTNKVSDLLELLLAQ